MEALRKALAPLTDWIPPVIRDRPDKVKYWEAYWWVWWLVFLVAALVVLLVVGHLLRRLWRGLFARRKPEPDWERNLRVDLTECPLPVQPQGDKVLSVYHVPVRLRLVVVAGAGKERDIDAIAVEKLLDRVLPGLGAIAARDRPRIRVWPPQLSQHGFVATFYRCTPKPEGEDQPSRWVLVAGRAAVGRAPLLLGLGLWTDEPTVIGRITLEPHQWLDVLRLRTADR